MSQILYGRITVYGEYLISEHTNGLVIPAQLYLATKRADKPIHKTYDHSQDCVARFLESRGFSTEREIYGNLPFGFGLASSTILAFLHTNRTTVLADAIPVVNDCDRAMHGFEPSGLDSASILRQAQGLFSTNKWKDIYLSPFLYSLAFPLAERTRTLVEIKDSMQSAIPKLSQLSNIMSKHILATGELDYNSLLEYSKILSKLTVYSESASNLIETLIIRGIVAKAIGGLYDKAILIVWPSMEIAERYMYLLDGYSHSSLFSSK